MLLTKELLTYISKSVSSDSIIEVKMCRKHCYKSLKMNLISCLNPKDKLLEV